MGRKGNVRNDLIPFKRLFIFTMVFLIVSPLHIPNGKGTKLSVDPVVKFELNETIISSSISSNGEYLAVGCRWEFVLTRPLAGGIIWTIKSQNNVFWDVAISGNGAYLATYIGIAGATRLYFFSSESNTPLWNAQVSVDEVTISRDGNFIGGCDGFGDVAYFFSKDSNEYIWKSLELIHGWQIDIMSITDDGKYIVTSDSHNETFLYESYNMFIPPRIYPEHWGKISPDGSVITAHNGSRLSQYTTESTEALWSHNLGADIYRVEIAQNGRYIMAATKDKKLHYFDSQQKGGPMWTIGFDDWIYDIEPSGNQKILISTYREVFLIEGETGRKARVLDGEEIRTISMTENGELFAVGINRTMYIFHTGQFEFPDRSNGLSPIIIISVVAAVIVILVVVILSIRSKYRKKRKNEAEADSSQGDVLEVVPMELEEKGAETVVFILDDLDDP